MDAQKFSIDEFEQNYEIKFYGLLGLKPKFKTHKPERYLTYYLILSDLRDFDEIDMIITIKYMIHRNKTTDEIFRGLILNSNNSIFNNYREIIKYFSQEDMTEMFF